MISDGARFTDLYVIHWFYEPVCEIALDS